MVPPATAPTPLPPALSAALSGSTSSSSMSMVASANQAVSKAPAPTPAPDQAREPFVKPFTPADLSYVIPEPPPRGPPVDQYGMPLPEETDPLAPLLPLVDPNGVPPEELPTVWHTSMATLKKAPAVSYSLAGHQAALKMRVEPKAKVRRSREEQAIHDTLALDKLRNPYSRGESQLLRGFGVLRAQVCFSLPVVVGLHLPFLSPFLRPLIQSACLNYPCLLFFFSSS